MKTVFTLLILLCLSSSYYCALDDNEYSVGKIPIELWMDADAVIRNRTVSFEIIDESNAIEKVKIAVTILNKEGQHYGRIILRYDKFHQIEDLEGRILDANGEEIRELKGKDIQDYSTFTDYNLYDDSRVKVAELYYDRYPYTVEFTYEKSYDGYLDWPEWYSRYSFDPVEFSMFEVIIPEGQQLRFWCNKDTVKPKVSKNGTQYIWLEKNIEGIPDEAVDNIEDDATIVYIAPSYFEIDDYKGNMTTWKEFGLWYYELCKDRDKLPEDAIAAIKLLIVPSDDNKQKIFKIYKYLQSRTRYVSVQLGIGGWQPFSAEYVHQRGYGDCKALSNYLIALLKEIDITAYPVLIYRGDNRLPLIKEFSCNQFNHVIVCVPQEKDTVWLECTDQTILPGMIDWTTENRYALMVTPEGGFLVKTPESLSDQNLQQKVIKVLLSGTGAEADGIIQWTGDQDIYTRYKIQNNTPIEQEKWLAKSFNVPDIKFKNYKFEFTGNPDEGSNLKLKLALPKYVTITGNRLFFYPNLMERRSSVPKEVDKRISPVRLNYPYLDIDSIYFVIPHGYKPEALPNEIHLSSSFGNFSAKVISLYANELLYVRLLEMKNYSIPAEAYNEYRKFIADIVKADRSQVVLVKSN